MKWVWKKKEEITSVLTLALNLRTKKREEAYLQQKAFNKPDLQDKWLIQQPKD